MNACTSVFVASAGSDRQSGRMLSVTVSVYLHSVLTASPGMKQYLIKWCATVVQGHSRLSKLVLMDSPY